MYINVSIVQHMHAAQPMFHHWIPHPKKKRICVCGHICQGKLTYLDWQVEEIFSAHFIMLLLLCVCVCVEKNPFFIHSTAKLKKHCLWVGAYKDSKTCVCCTWGGLLLSIIITQDLCVFFFWIELNWIESKVFTRVQESWWKSTMAWNHLKYMQ
jgi:hypothetical protein